MQHTRGGRDTSGRAGERESMKTREQQHTIGMRTCGGVVECELSLCFFNSLSLSQFHFGQSLAWLSLRIVGRRKNVTTSCCCGLLLLSASAVDSVLEFTFCYVIVCELRA